ncbi:hypothetical protein Xedl_03835 [Xenorhabdus eapokensis]|uniref:Uncharacterized protein n=1 Tax=Xenorhabdus eapokensis TaxID=1873482 RepID=A0A1Q5TEE7_9GAMM|nr:hypothetical protein Xedl_03835 [Xenorhabdus eapokensis]
MAARGFDLGYLLLVVVMPGGGMALRCGGTGDTRFISQLHRVKPATADTVDTTALRVIGIIHRGLVTIRPAANQPLFVIVIEQVKLLGAVRFSQPAVDMIAIADHHVIQTVIRAADVSQQAIFTVEQPQFRPIAVGDFFQLMGVVIVKTHSIAIAITVFSE